MCFTDADSSINATVAASSRRRMLPAQLLAEPKTTPARAARIAVTGSGTDAGMQSWSQCSGAMTGWVVKDAKPLKFDYPKK